VDQGGRYQSTINNSESTACGGGCVGGETNSSRRSPRSDAMNVNEPAGHCIAIQHHRDRQQANKSDKLTSLSALSISYRTAEDRHNDCALHSASQRQLPVNPQRTHRHRRQSHHHHGGRIFESTRPPVDQGTRQADSHGGSHRQHQHERVESRPALFAPGDCR
jgi:hypothetical protein